MKKVKRWNRSRLQKGKKGKEGRGKKLSAYRKPRPAKQRDFAQYRHDAMDAEP